jgi:hypothetical protein
MCRSAAAGARRAGLAVASIAALATLAAAPRAVDAATVRYVEGDTLIAHVQEHLVPGDTLLIGAGRWSLTEELISGITVRGDGPVDSVVLVPFVPSAPIFLFLPGPDTTRVENLTFDCAEWPEATGLYFKGATMAVRNCSFLRGYGIQASDAHGVIADCRFGETKTAIQCENSEFWVDRNEILASRNSAISMRGSPLRITRNRITQSVNLGIVVVGKRYVPVIGGEPGMGNEIHGGFNSDLFTSSGKEINAQYNYWGIKSTGEMNRLGYPADIDAIVDGWDQDKAAGRVDYRNWLTAPLGATAAPATRSGRSILFLGGAGALVLIAALVAVGRRRKSA